MERGRASSGSVATIGFAANPNGAGVAYAAVKADGKRERTIRVSFEVGVRPALRGRDVAYAALLSVVERLIAGDVGVAEFRLDDPALVLDLAERRGVPNALAMPYVELRCALNRFGAARVVECHDGTARDLRARALAEVSLEVAA